MFQCLFIYLFIYLFIHSFIYLFICLITESVQIPLKFTGFIGTQSEYVWGLFKPLKRKS